MDKRFALELLPGVAFIAGNMLGGLFFAATIAAFATAVAVGLRWHWDKQLPWLAVAIFALTMIMLGVGFIFNDATFIKVRPTIGSVVFALFVLAGALMRPTLLERSLGYKLSLTKGGWPTMHLAWAALSLVRAAANELVWRQTTDDQWAWYNGLSDFAWFGAFFALTWLVAHIYWDEKAPEHR